MWLTVVPSHSPAWYRLLPRMALTFVLDLVLGPPPLRGTTVWCWQTGQGSRPFVVSAINHLRWLCRKLSSDRKTPCTYLGFALCTFPVPGELRIACRLCCPVLGSRIDSRVRRYQLGVEKAGSAEYFPGYRTQKRYSTVVIIDAFVTFPFVDVGNGCIIELLLRNSPAVPYISVENLYKALCEVCATVLVNFGSNRIYFCPAAFTLESFLIAAVVSPVCVGTLVRPWAIAMLSCQSLPVKLWMTGLAHRWSVLPTVPVCSDRRIRL